MGPVHTDRPADHFLLEVRESQTLGIFPEQCLWMCRCGIIASTLSWQLKGGQTP